MTSLVHFDWNIWSLHEWLSILMGITVKKIAQTLSTKEISIWDLPIQKYNDIQVLQLNVTPNTYCYITQSMLPKFQSHLHYLP